jgi:hypothetical protein
MNALLGKAKRRGPRSAAYHDLLEWIAFDYSVETQWGQRDDVSAMSTVRGVVEHHPLTRTKAQRESIVRNLERTFSAHKDELVALHGYDGAEGFAEFYAPIVRALRALAETGVPVDLTVVPPLAVNGDNSAK